MKKTIFLSFFLFLIVFAGACKKNNNDDDMMDDDDMVVVETTVAQDKQNIQNTFTEALACVQTMKDGDLVNAFFRKFLNMSDGDVLNEDWIENIFDELDNVANIDVVDESGRFDIGLFAATYAYNISSNTWTKNTNTTNKVLIQFPSSPTEISNNAQITIENYEDENVTVEGDNLWLPKKVNIAIDVDNEEVMSLSLNNVEYAQNADFEIPIAIDMSMNLSPFNMTFKVDRITPTNFNVDMAMVGNGCNIGIDANIILENSEYENITGDAFGNALQSVTVELQINELKIKSLTGLAELIQLADSGDELSENEINSILDIEVLFQDIKIGDLTYGGENNAYDDTFIITYKDNTSEDTFTYYESFVQDMEDLITEFWGE